MSQGGHSLPGLWSHGRPCSTILQNGFWTRVRRYRVCLRIILLHKHFFLVLTSLRSLFSLNLFFISFYMLRFHLPSRRADITELLLLEIRRATKAVWLPRRYLPNNYFSFVFVSVKSYDVIGELTPLLLLETKSRVRYHNFDFAFNKHCSAIFGIQ